MQDRAAPQQQTVVAPDPIGVVIAIRGSQVSVGLALGNDQPTPRVTIGSFVAIQSGRHSVVGVVSTLSTDGWIAGPEASARAEVDLLGQISDDGTTAGNFRRGVTHYPALGDTVDTLSNEQLALIYRVASEQSVTIGSLYQDPSIPACVKINDLLSKHFAILGSTGVGKSSAVAVIVDSLMQSGNDLRVFLLDVHNEYAACFGEAVNVIGPQSLKLPFWLFSLEELSDAIYGGRPSCDEEIEILAEVIPLAKIKYGQYKDSGERQLEQFPSGLTRAGLHGEARV